jgi:hypothetical protein
MVDYSHVPRYYGKLRTNLGDGFIVDLICDFDGEESRSLQWYFKHGVPVSEFVPYLDSLKANLLKNQIIFNVDMGRFNILFQKLSYEEARLVVIDGLGNHTAINLLDGIPFFARRKIERRWQRFIGRLEKYSDKFLNSFDGEPRQLPSAYRDLV